MKTIKVNVYDCRYETLEYLKYIKDNIYNYRP